MINQARRKLKALFLICFITVVICCIQIQQPREEIVQNTFDDFSIIEDGDLKLNGVKNILFWTRFFNNPSWVIGGEEAGAETLKSVDCPVTNCFFTHNRNHLDDITNFDAIAFHGPEYEKVPRPVQRNSNQMYIFASLE
jgi:hypothetical protein